ncbi:flagellar biosynthesis protein FlgF [Rhodococcus sp. SRB_17]|uniref:flagellar basal body rod protein FlgF n=1 Tax=Acidovorax sp. SRB_24 TaxID=1962700 RepID=UPI00145D8E16|nr:flagellar basal body rod protein FlgF [Acidovorax sp. SRB_24]NMM76303.1 flagellar biosynthesis protein FlgF [Acidovorax sp. SRB_24]NMM76395.1 flagellar biosynthesis protein FlgF [Acidovorax sp. SRB_24]NMM84865.1 flagellar biosynthesis protein FlgF [Rhodococcus sp. SRB_17]
MDALIYSAMSGAERSLRAQQVHANNLANLQTSGFRADLELATSQSVDGFGYDARHMSQLQANAVNTRAGTLAPTGRDLDAAISGEGFFTVAHGNGEAYTRSGAFALDSSGTLTLNGRAVIGDGGPIVLPPASRIAIGADGTISVQPNGQETMQPVDRLKLVKPAANDLTKNEAGLIVGRAGVALPADDTVQVRSGHLESSNVSAVEEMVATMTLSRDFEFHMKLFKAADDMAANGNRLLRE